MTRGIYITAPAKTKQKVQGRLPLDVVVGEGAAVLELLAGKDEALLVVGDALLVLDLGLDVVNGVAGLDLERDSLTRQGLDEDLIRGGVGGRGLQVRRIFRSTTNPLALGKINAKGSGRAKSYLHVLHVFVLTAEGCLPL